MPPIYYSALQDFLDTSSAPRLPNQELEAWDTAVNSLQQWTGDDESALSRWCMEKRNEWVPTQPSKPLQSGRY